MEIISWFIGLLLSWYVWLPAVLILGYLTWRNYQRIDAVRAIESTLLILEIPKTNDKPETAAEQLFASLHGILRDKEELKLAGGIQEHLSFEIASVNGQIRFYVWVPTALRSFVEGQIYAQYPTVQIHEADEDYVAHERMHTVTYTSEITLTDSEFLPIKSFLNFEVDPLAGITGTLAKLEATGEELWVQVLVRPIPDVWHKSTSAWIKRLKTGPGPFAFLTDGKGFDAKWMLGLIEAFWKPPEQGVGGTAAPKELSDRDKTRVAEAEKKATKLGYQVKIRLAYLGESQTNAKLQMQAIVGTYKQYNSTNLNGFKMTGASFQKEELEKYRARLFTDKGYILNIEELASVFHLPHTNVETPNIVWASSKTAEPPAKLPVITGNDAIDENISAFGLTNFRGINHQFGMLRTDRSRHMYIIGQTGAGKSGTLALLALSDIYHGQGYAIIDPHGDFAIDNMKFIPAARIKDVVYFNPADTAFPLGFNPLEVTDPSMKSNISSEVIGVLKRMFGESWGPRLEYILRYTILALLDRPETTMLDITRMLTDKKFRKDTLSYCKDTVVLQFWNIEFASWNDKFQAEAIAPVLNKVGAFTANPIIRNIIGQPRSTFNVREMMDEGKILIVNLSKGLLGEDNSGILGSFLVTKIQLAAMSRSDIPNIEDRRPFYLYVDEFQNFATDSFATILSEARKYGLNLTVANQYISQMSDTVRDAVFGNVGTMVSFRVSADDSPILVKQFEPQFEANDLLQMHNRNFVINMVIGGEKAPAFSARTLQLPPAQTDNSAAIIEQTRANFSQRREVVEQAINDLIQPPETLQRKGPGNPDFKPVPHPNDKQLRPGDPGYQPVQPQSQAQAKQWPVDSGARPVKATPAPAAAAPSEPNRPKFIIETPAGEAAVGIQSTHQKPAEQEPRRAEESPKPTDEASDQPPKRKRTRSRRKKSGPTEGTPGEHSADNRPPREDKREHSQTHEQKPQHQQPKDTLKVTHAPTPASAHQESRDKPAAPPQPERHPQQPPKPAEPSGMGVLRVRR